VDIPSTTETTSISLPTWLLELIDRYAKRADMNRSQFIVRAVRKYLLLKYDSPALWKQIYQNQSEASCDDL
jgi:metal-responsive CopG/Arc/MetJ family transcriptional regulator